MQILNIVNLIYLLYSISNMRPPLKCNYLKLIEWKAIEIFLSQKMIVYLQDYHDKIYFKLHPDIAFYSHTINGSKEWCSPIQQK
jgi:hypothetical protein